MGGTNGIGCTPDTGQLQQDWEHESAVFAIAVSPDGTAVATGTDEGLVRVWDVQSGELLLGPIAHADRIDALDFDAQGELLAVGVHAHQSNIAVYSVSTSELRTRTSTEVDVPITSAAFDPSGRFLAVGTLRQELRLWELQTERWLPAIVKNNGRIYGLAFHHQRPLLAAACADGTARLFDMTTLEPTGPNLQHDADVYDVAFSTAGNLLATSSRDGTVRLWSMEGEVLPFGAPLRHDRLVVDVAIHPSRPLLATACQDDFVRLWHLPTPPPNLRAMELSTWVSLGLRYDAEGDLESIPWRQWRAFKEELR